MKKLTYSLILHHTSPPPPLLLNNVCEVTQEAIMPCISCTVHILEHRGEGGGGVTGQELVTLIFKA